MQTVVVSADREFRERGAVIALMCWAPKTRPGRGSGTCACLAGDAAPVSEDVLFGGCEGGGGCWQPQPEEHADVGSVLQDPFGFHQWHLAHR
jgi:hypothetical protein